MNNIQAFLDILSLNLIEPILILYVLSLFQSYLKLFLIRRGLLHCSITYKHKYLDYRLFEDIRSW